MFFRAPAITVMADVTTTVTAPGSADAGSLVRMLIVPGTTKNIRMKKSRGIIGANRLDVRLKCVSSVLN